MLLCMWRSHTIFQNRFYLFMQCSIVKDMQKQHYLLSIAKGDMYLVSGVQTQSVDKWILTSATPRTICPHRNIQPQPLSEVSPSSPMGTKPFLYVHQITEVISRRIRSMSANKHNVIINIMNVVILSSIDSYEYKIKKRRHPTFFG